MVHIFYQQTSWENFLAPQFWCPAAEGMIKDRLQAHHIVWAWAKNQRLQVVFLIKHISSKSSYEEASSNLGTFGIFPVRTMRQACIESSKKNAGSSLFLELGFEVTSNKSWYCSHTGPLFFLGSALQKVDSVREKL